MENLLKAQILENKEIDNGCFFFLKQMLNKKQLLLFL